jgi:hypothetical protein
MSRKLEQTAFVLIAIASIVISLLDLFGLVDNIPWLSGRLTTITLLITGSVAGYLAIEHNEVATTLEKIELDMKDGFEHVIVSLEGAEVVPIKAPREYYEYMRKRITEAQFSVDDLTWGLISPSRRTEIEERAFQHYVKSISATCHQKKQLRYREIMTFPHIHRIERAENMLNERLVNYSLRHYDLPHERMPPLIQFMVIDSKEVLFGIHRGVYLPAEGEFFFAVKHPIIVRYFEDYFNAIWQGASIIKDLNQIHSEILHNMRERLRAESPVV